MYLPVPCLQFHIEEAILGVISGIDAPGSPSGEAQQAFHNTLFGRGGQFRSTKRNNILGVTVEDVRRVANDYLKGPVARAIVMNENGLKNLPSTFVIKQI